MKDKVTLTTIKVAYNTLKAKSLVVSDVKLGLRNMRLSLFYFCSGMCKLQWLINVPDHRFRAHLSCSPAKSSTASGGCNYAASLLTVDLHRILFKLPCNARKEVINRKWGILDPKLDYRVCKICRIWYLNWERAKKHTQPYDANTPCWKGKLHNCKNLSSA